MPMTLALNSFLTLNSKFEFCGVAGAEGKAIAHHLAGEKGPSKSVGVIIEPTLFEDEEDISTKFNEKI